MYMYIYILFFYIWLFIYKYRNAPYIGGLYQGLCWGLVVGFCAWYQFLRAIRTEYP